MKITKIDAVPINLKLKKETLTKKTAASTVFVRIITDEGVIGYGEGSPSSKTFPGETQGTAIEIIRKNLAPVLIGEDPFSIPKLIRNMDQAIQGHNAAKSAIDLALHDLDGKAIGIPVYMMMGGLFREALPVFELMGVADAAESAQAAKALVQEGVENLKVKVGYDFNEDRERLRAIRGAVGEKAFIKIDVNQKWSVPEAIRFLKEAEEKGWINCVEQPIDAFNREGIRRIKQFISTPIMADEAVFCLEDGKNLVENRGYDFYNLKISRIGGLYKAKKYAEFVGGLGCYAMAGAGFNSRLLDAAGCHLFASSPQVIFQELKSIRGYWLEDRMTEEIMSREGMVFVPNKPGLGIEIDESIFNDK